MGLILAPGTSGAGYTTTANDYDGTNDYQLRGSVLTGIANGKQGTFSTWFRVDADDDQIHVFLEGGSFVVALFGANYPGPTTSHGRISIQATNGVDPILAAFTNTLFAAGPGWHHLLASWDLSDPAKRYQYVDDVSDMDVVDYVNDTIHYTAANYSLGGSPGGTLLFNGCLSEMFFHTTYLDLSVVANRRKFISSSGKPVSLGADGSLPLGVQPLLYVPDGDASGAGNKGTGGAFTTVGALTACTSSPSTGPVAGLAASDYDGVNDYQTRGAALTGAADGKQGTFSCWLRIDGGAGTNRAMLDATTTVGGSTDHLGFLVATTNKLLLEVLDAPATQGIAIQSTQTFAAGASWINVVASWDVSDPAKTHLYINDVLDLDAVTIANVNLDYTLADWAIGAQPSGGAKFNGCISELFFDTRYIDLSVTDNRRKFISAMGKPVFLGPDGSRPFGVQPLLYVPNGDASGSGNKGSGGAFTTTGALTACSTTPGP